MQGCFQLTNIVERDVEENITVKKAPSQEDLQSFWSDILKERGDLNPNALLLNTTEREYCANSSSKIYKIDAETFVIAVGKLQSGKVLRRDVIVGYL